MSGLSPPIETALLWALWCFFHSLLISRWWMRLMRRLLGSRLVAGWYRIFFVVVSAVTVTPVLVHQFLLPQRLLFAWPGWWLGIKIFLYVYGFYMFYAGLRRYDLAFFLGLRQLRAAVAGATPPPAPFSANRIGGVRHPWYSGGIALVVAFGPVTDVTLASRLIISAYFVIGALLEERKLLAEFGKAYQQYCRELPMLFPWPRVKR